jgi:hypothetical protein
LLCGRVPNTKFLKLAYIDVAKQIFGDSSLRFFVGLIEGSLEVQLPTIWTDEKAEVGRGREEKRRSKKIREEKESEERRCGCAKR